MEKNIKEIVEKEVPLLMVISDNDKVMNKRLNARLVSACGANMDEDSYIYDEEGKLVKMGLSHDRIKIIRSKSGGHFSFIKYSDVINRAVVDHLYRVVASSLPSVENQVKTGPATDNVPLDTPLDTSQWKRVKRSAHIDFLQ